MCTGYMYTYIYIISIYYVYLHYNIYSINLSTNRTSEHTIFTITEVDLAIKHGVLTFKWLLTFILWFGSDWAQRIPRKRSSADRLRQMIRKHFFRQYGPKSETCKPLHGMILKPLQWCCRISLYIYIYSLNHTKTKKAVGIFVCTEYKDSTLIQGVILCASSQVVWRFFCWKSSNSMETFPLSRLTKWQKPNLCGLLIHTDTSWCCIPQTVWNTVPSSTFRPLRCWGMDPDNSHGDQTNPSLKLRGCPRYSRYKKKHNLPIKY